MKHKYWLALLLGIDCFYALLLWLLDDAAFFSLAAACLLATGLLFGAVLLFLRRREKEQKQRYLLFLQDPTEENEALLLEHLPAEDAAAIRALGLALRGQQQAQRDLLSRISDYESYVESWAHEVKTPLSLLTLLLDNPNRTLPEETCFKLNYIRSHMLEAVDRMLYYARLKSVHKDWYFAPVSLQDCIDEVLSDYQPLLEQKGFQVRNLVPPVWVYTDRRGLVFLLRQLVSNTVKYSGKDPTLTLAFSGSVLTLSDNGIGVRSCDLPHIFDRGFTGNSQKSATGMGLYLASSIAKELCLTLTSTSQWGKGFQMEISFPEMQADAHMTGAISC